jgi:hypothetical protein
VNTEDKADLRDMRDNTTNEEDKRLLRKALNYIFSLETRLATARTLMRAALNETQANRKDD